MKLPEMKDDAFLRLAMKEDYCAIRAGGLDGVFQEKQISPNDVALPMMKFAFGDLINLQRRRQAWTIEELAKQAQIDIEEAVAIEENPVYRPDPRSVYQLAKVLALPTKKLLILSGNAELPNARLEHAAVQFAARSRVLEKLSDAEASALNEFMAALAEEEDDRRVSR